MRINAMALKRILKAVPEIVTINVSHRGIVLSYNNVTLYCKAIDDIFTDVFSYSFEIVTDAIRLPINFIRSSKTEIEFEANDFGISLRVIDKKNFVTHLDGKKINPRNFWDLPKKGILIDDYSGFYGICHYSKEVSKSEFIPMTKHGRLFVKENCFQIDVTGLFENALYYQKTNKELTHKNDYIRKFFNIEELTKISEIIKTIKSIDQPYIYWNKKELIIFNEDYKVVIDMEDSNELLMKYIEGESLDNYDTNSIVNLIVSKGADLRYKQRRLEMIVLPDVEFQEDERFYLLHYKRGNSKIQYIITKKRT